MPLKDLLITHRKLLLCRHVFSIFLTLLKGSVEYYISLSEIHIGSLRKNCQRKQIFEQTLSFSFKSFLSFLCKGVTLASFKELGNIDDLNAVLIHLHKKSAKVFHNSRWNITILRDLFAAQLIYFLFYFFDFYFFETKDTIFCVSLIARMLGRFLYFKTALRTRPFMFSIIGSKSL